VPLLLAVVAVVVERLVKAQVMVELAQLRLPQVLEESAAGVQKMQPLPIVRTFLILLFLELEAEAVAVTILLQQATQPTELTLEREAEAVAEV
jgi:hypothetical protein